MIHTFVPRCRVTESKLKGERDGLHLHPSPPPLASPGFSLAPSVLPTPSR